MKKIDYLCRAEQTVWAKAYASASDFRVNAPSRGIHSCRTEQPGFCVSSITDMSRISVRHLRLCLLIQYGFYKTVYCFSL